MAEATARPTNPPGTLVLVGTPLGNRGDWSTRAREAVLSADLLLCEDTRSPSRLLPDQSLPPRQSCFVGNEHERVPMLLDALADGKTVVFVSEAGMPGWSDPGRRLVEAAAGAGHLVDVIPGPTAAATALCHSGLPTDEVLFLGFIARGGAQRDEVLARIAGSTATVILYEAGNRTAALLSDLAHACADAGTRRVAVARELTKMHQEVVRGSLVQVANETKGAVRGEVTVVIEGSATERADDDAATAGARAVLDAMLDDGLKPRERAKRIAAQTGLDPREVYERLSKR